MSRTSLLTSPSLQPYFSCHHHSFLLQFLLQTAIVLFINVKQAALADFVTHSSSWKPQNPTRPSRVHLGIMSVSVESPKVDFIPVRFTELSSVYAIWRGKCIIYNNATNIKFVAFSFQLLCLRDDTAELRRFILHPRGRAVYPPLFC